MSQQSLLENSLSHSLFENSDEMYGVFKNAIENYQLMKGIDNVVFLFSGGKDATVGLYFLNNYIKEKELKINLKTILVTYPQHVYYNSDGSETACFTRTKQFWSSNNVEIDIFDSRCKDLEDEAIEGCKVCKAARKEIVDKYIKDIGNTGKTAIVTGYTLYDILAYLDEYCLMTNYSLDSSDTGNEKLAKRISNCLHKMKIKEELPNGFRIIRPLAVLKEDSIMNYINEHGIPFVNNPCKIGSKKHKRAYFNVLNLISRVNNASYEGVLKFLSKHNVELPETYEDIEYENYFTDC